jgi:hypothetical protein
MDDVLTHDLTAKDLSQRAVELKLCPATGTKGLHGYPPWNWLIFALTAKSGSDVVTREPSSTLVL